MAGIPSDGGNDTERLQDVLEWDAAGKLKTWIRVFEPRRSQRDWLLLISKGKSGGLAGLLDATVRFAVSDGPAPRCYAGYARTTSAAPSMPTARRGRPANLTWSYSAAM